jgi:hypothetical protein
MGDAETALREDSPSSRRVLNQPPHIVQRWMRMKVAGKAHRWAHSGARLFMRWRLPRLERERRRALEQAFDAIKTQTIKLEHGAFSSTRTIFNIALFVLLAERDIDSLKIDALTHPEEWRRKLCARVILLTIHELDFDKVSGKPLRDALEAIGAPDALRKEAFQALREVRAVQTRARKEFSALRNATIAHRDPDALLQYRAIRNLDTDTVFAIAADFYVAARQFIDVVPRLMLESGSLGALLRQYVQSEKQA